MASVITIAQQKGGAGKTTLVAQIATALRSAGRTVALIDIDPQASLTGWMRLREHTSPPPPDLRFSMVGGWRLGVEIDRLRREADFVLVDTPPHAESEAKGAIRAADLVVVPCQPSPADLWASRATLDLAMREGKDARMVLNRVPSRAKGVEEARETIRRQGWPLLQAELGNRQSFVASFGRGLGVVESEPRSAAAEEVRALVMEIAGQLG